MAMSSTCYMSDYTCMFVKHKFWKESAEKVCDDEEDIQGKIAIVTGSNTGIGKETALQLAKRGAVVIMGVRNLEKGKEALDDIHERIGKDKKLEMMKIDMGDMQSIRDFVKEFQGKYPHLNILINNAGIMDLSGVLKTTKDGVELHIGTNHLGPFLLTRLLLDSLKKGAPSRIICNQSGNLVLANLDLDDLSGEPKLKTGDMKMEQYNIAKLLNSICMVKLAKSLEGQGIKLFQLCPGFVKTQMTADAASNMFSVMKTLYNAAQGLVAVTPHQSCETLVYLSVTKSLAEQEDSGKGEIYRFKVLWTKGDKILKDYDLNEKTDSLYKLTEEKVGLS